MPQQLPLFASPVIDTSTCARKGCNRPISNYGTKYCGVECAGTADKRVQITCLRCGKTRLVPPSVVKKGFGKYCGQACAYAEKQDLFKCEECGKEERLARWRVKKKRYCSRECHLASMRKVITCLVCGKTRNVKKSQLAKRASKYCSHQCWCIDRRTVDYANTRAALGYTPRLIKKTRKLYDYTCQECGLYHKGGPGVWALEVHHIDCELDNNQPENLIVLCFSCHRGKDRGWHYVTGYERAWRQIMYTKIARKYNG